MVHLIPGDAALAILGERASEGSLAKLRQEMGLNLHLYQQNDPDPLFDENQTSLNVTCEYCKKEYHITAEDLIQNPDVFN